MSNEPRDTVHVGKKPLQVYASTALIQLTNVPSISIRARGLNISRAVDVAELTLRRAKGISYSVGEIKIGSELRESNDGKTRNVSTIEIEIKKDA